MNEEQEAACEWAANKRHPTIDAIYANILHGLVQEQEQTILEIELNYPNWRGKFQSLAEAIKWHTDSQDKVIANLRAQIASGGN
jgi:hypothetical protein